MDGTRDWDDVPVFGSTLDAAIVRPSAYALLADDAGRVAVVHTPRGTFLPGGGIHPGETAAQAVVREVLEECGMQVSAGEWSVRAVEFAVSWASGKHYEKRCTFLEASVQRRGLPASEPDHRLEWLPAHAVMESLLTAGQRWAVAQWRRR